MLASPLQFRITAIASSLSASPGHLMIFSTLPHVDMMHEPSAAINALMDAPKTQQARKPMPGTSVETRKPPKSSHRNANAGREPYLRFRRLR